jgi:hypothetical protein
MTRRRHRDEAQGDDPPGGKTHEATDAATDEAATEAVTEAAVEAVSEAIEFADEQELEGRVLPARRRLGRLGRRSAGRPERDQGIRQLGAAVGRTTRRGARVTGRGVTTGGKWLSSQVLAMAPRLPVRDLATLRAHFPNRSPDDLADALIERASRASATVGVAVGAWAVLPFPPAAGVEIATETLAVVGIEIKLTAELHEVYGMRAPGGVIDRMTAYVGAWAQRRGVALAPGGLVMAAGSPLARQLQRRLAARAGRSVASLGPLLTGAAAGGLINRRETRKLGHMLRDDLRKRSPHPDAWPELTP